MESLTPTQQLEPFRLFCAEGKIVKPRRNPSSAAPAQYLLRQQQACREVYEVLIEVLLKLNASDLPIDGCLSQEVPSASLVELLGLFVADDTDESSTQLQCVAVACFKAVKTPEGNIDWRVDDEEVRVLSRAQTVFYQRLTSKTVLRQKLVTELQAYEVRLGERLVQTEVHEIEVSPTEVPPILMRSAIQAQELADSVYGALEEFTTAACGCDASPKPHCYDLRLPFLASQFSSRFLKLQMRRLQDKWQHAWIGLTSISDPVDVKHATGLCAQLQIAGLHSHYLNFALREGTLQVCPLQSRPHSSPEFATEARSLESLINGFPQLGRKMMLITALKLALSAVYLYGSGWLKQVWNDSNIWFIERDANCIPPHPYLGTCLPSKNNEHYCTSLCFGCIKQQKSPHLLHLASLGLMLMEIHSGTTARQFAKECELSNDSTIVIAGHFFDDHWREMEENEDYEYLSAVRACLDRSFGIEGGRSVPLEELRSQMLKRIVAPLYKALHYFCPLRIDLERALSDESATLIHLGNDLESELDSLGV